MSLKMRLWWIVTLTILLGMVLTVWMLLKNAQTAIQVEMSTAMRLAQELMSANIPNESYQQRAVRMESFLTTLSNSHYVHVKVMGLEGDKVVDFESNVKTAPQVPTLFKRWMMPSSEQVPQLVIHGSTPWSNPVIIEANPDEGIAQAWRNTYPILGLGVALMLLVTLLLHQVLRQSLKPLQALQQGFSRLTVGDFAYRLVPSTVQELRPIQQDFNQMASVLALSMAENRQLAQQLLHLQEDERRGIARELHDEMGPLFFALKVDLHLLQKAQQQQAYERIPAVQESLADLVAQLQQRTRALLEHLHPVDLDGVSLQEALQKLLETWRSRVKNIQFHFAYQDIPVELDAALTTTVYRMVQEGVTNIVRHAAATEAWIALAIDESGDALQVLIEDNGVGLGQQAATKGLGLIGMRERVLALGGTLEAETRAEGGTRLRASLPLMSADYANNEY